MKRGGVSKNAGSKSSKRATSPVLRDIMRCKSSAKTKDERLRAIRHGRRSSSPAGGHRDDMPSHGGRLHLLIVFVCLLLLMNYWDWR